LPSAAWYFTSSFISFVALRATKEIKIGSTMLPKAKTAFDMADLIPKEDMYA